MSFQAAMAGAQLLGAGVNSIISYHQNKDKLSAQMDSIRLASESLNIRDMQSAKALRRQARRNQARVKEQFIGSGVKLEGSAMTVLGDALLQELEAESARQRTFGEQRTQLALNRHAIKSAQDNLMTSTLLNFASQAVGIGAQYGMSQISRSGSGSSGPRSAITGSSEMVSYANMPDLIGDF